MPLDVDHITAIDNLVRMHNARKSARWVGTGFSAGHMISILSEMLLIIYIVGSTTSSKLDQLSFSGGVTGAIALATIGAINIYSMKRWGKTGSAILASKIVTRTHILRPFGSAVVTGLVFGIGFDTATQISALTLSVVASATLGVQVALMLAGFFALGLIPVDTLDSVVLRSAFSRMFNTKRLHVSVILVERSRPDNCSFRIVCSNNQCKNSTALNRSSFSNNNYCWRFRIWFCNKEKKGSRSIYFP